MSPRRPEPETPRREKGTERTRKGADVPYALHVVGSLPHDIVDRISEAHAVAVAHLIEQQENTRAHTSRGGLK